MSGVSYVVPVHNGATCIRATVHSILAQDDRRPREVILVDDGSHDDSSAVLQDLAALLPVRIVSGEGRGAAAAINTGIRAARHPVICQVDQDVILRPDWTRRLLAALDDPAVAAAQGYYTAAPGASLAARAMGLDLEQRYAAIKGPYSNHVCTGNSAYRSSALHQAGLFDEALGYGYDNDMSYRLESAGYRLAFCREARSVHQWREGFIGYLIQQYGFGYGRLDVVAKHPRRVRGDAVSPWPMMAHAGVMAMAIAAALDASLTGVIAAPWSAVVAVVLLAALMLDRGLASIRATRRFGDPAALLFVPLHLARDVAWVAAIIMWVGRRLLFRAPSPLHSMRSREGSPRARLHADMAAREGTEKRAIAIIPAFNEAASLSAVIAELRSTQRHLDILIVDDGSTDGTESLLPTLGVKWLTFPQRLGVGSAMRAGLRYAHRAGYDLAVRVDGDGQHRAADIDALLAPVVGDRVDVALGSRYTAGRAEARRTWILQRGLALCLSFLTRTRVTDPTSGFCAIGPRALRVLSEHHPTGYPEPELRLFLSRNRLRVTEVAVLGRPRFGGTTSLTAVRLAGAAARVLLAMIIVPVRGRVWIRW
jgi:glycosyltransferase involved in cell wall biosynthesis